MVKASDTLSRLTTEKEIGYPQVSEAVDENERLIVQICFARSKQTSNHRIAQIYLAIIAKIEDGLFREHYNEDFQQMRSKIHSLLEYKEDMQDLVILFENIWKRSGYGPKKVSKLWEDWVKER